MLLCGMLVLVVNLADAASPPRGETEQNHYALIGERNIFHLNPTPEPEPVKEGPPPDIKITGFIKTDTEWKALFALPGKDAKDPPTYVSLGEGEQNGPIQLVKILPEKESCDVVNAGKRMTLSFKENSYASIPAKPVSPPLPR
jgi:hypothetical protein